jgi:hypothetical protein
MTTDEIIEYLNNYLPDRSQSREVISRIKLMRVTGNELAAELFYLRHHKTLETETRLERLLIKFIEACK